MSNAVPGHLHGLGRTHTLPIRPLACSPTGRREPGVRTRSKAGARAVATGCAPPPPASLSWGSSLGPTVTRCGAPAGPFLLWTSVFPCPTFARVRDLGPARPGAHRPSRRAGQQSSFRSTPAPPPPARGNADALVPGRGRERGWAGGARMPHPPRTRPQHSRANRRGRLAPCGATRWGQGLRGLRRVRGLAAGGGRAEVVATTTGPETATQRAGGHDRAGQAPQPAAAAASP